MIILKRSLFSKGLIKYKEYKDEDFDNMTKFQKLKTLEEEYSTALRNSTNIEFDKAIKGGLVGSVVTGVPSILAYRNTKGGLTNGLAVGAVGGMIGALAGSSIGKRIAKKKGHDRYERTLNLARKMDEHARKNHLEDDFEDRVLKGIRAQEEIRDLNSGYYIGH